jgi:hypothetical protein
MKSLLLLTTATAIIFFSCENKNETVHQEIIGYSLKSNGDTVKKIIESRDVKNP